LACGADKLIDAPAQVQPYRFVDVKVLGEFESAIFTVEPETGVDQRVSADGRVLTFVAPPGAYTVRVVAVSFSAKKLAQGKAVVTIGEAPVPPGPTPPTPPTPEPPKPPTPKVLWAIVVEETSERTKEQAAVLLSPKVEAAFKATGGKLQIIDGWDASGKRRDVGPLKLYVDRSEALKIRPLLVIVGPDGTVYHEGALPAKVADVESVVAKILKGGKP